MPYRRKKVGSRGVSAKSTHIDHLVTLSPGLSDPDRYIRVNMCAVINALPYRCKEVGSRDASAKSTHNNRQLNLPMLG